MTALALNSWILDSAAGSLDRPQIRLLPRIFYHTKCPTFPKKRGAKDKGQSAPSAEDLSLSATCMAESRVVVVPTIDETEPALDHLAAVLVEARDAEVATTAPHNSLPTEHRFTLEVLAEESDTFLPDFFEVASAEVVLEVTGFIRRAFQMSVDLVSFDPLPTLLAVMEPPLDVGDVVLERTASLQIGMKSFLHPVGIARLDCAVNPNDRINDDLGSRSGFDLDDKFGFATEELEHLSALLFATSESREVLEFPTGFRSSNRELMSCTTTEFRRIHVNLSFHFGLIPSSGLIRFSYMLDSSSQQRMPVKTGAFCCGEMQSCISKILLLYYIIYIALVKLLWGTFNLEVQHYFRGLDCEYGT